MHAHPESEWLETDGRGGYASGTFSGKRTRKYHGYLTVANEPPVNRVALVTDMHLRVFSNGKEYNLNEQQYGKTVVHVREEVQVTHESFPVLRSTYVITNVGTVQKEWFMVRGSPCTVLSITCEWEDEDAYLEVRPLFSGRPHHEVWANQEPWSLTYSTESDFCWQLKKQQIFLRTNGTFTSDEHIYEQIIYSEEKSRGYDYQEQNYCPGYITSKDSLLQIVVSSEPIIGNIQEKIQHERTRKQNYQHPLHKTADDFVVERSVFEGTHKTVPTILAGYPWFTDWGRDTFIAMRGLLLSQERFAEAEELLVFWAKQLHDGLLPNRFIDEDNEPEFNSIDSPLWFIVACFELLEAYPKIHAASKTVLQSTCSTIVQTLKRGTDYSISADVDGLLLCGEEGVQLTWMDALYNGKVITPRIGKPVEIQALWINALYILWTWNELDIAEVEKAKQSFLRLFWNKERGYLNDVIEAEYIDDSLRPNQLFALGCLPFCVIDDNEMQKSIVQIAEAELVTPLGIRTLSPTDEQYIGAYTGSQAARDAAYHQGTAWPWLLGPYSDAYMTVHGVNETTKRYLKTLWEQCFTTSQAYGANGICEVANGTEPHVPNGCPWQAWSVSEYLRVEKKYNL